MEVCKLAVITQKGFSPMEVAKMLGVSQATIYREIEKGKLKSVEDFIREKQKDIEIENRRWKEEQ